MHIHFDFWPTLSFALVMFSWFLFAIVFVIQKRPPSPPDKERDPASLMGVMLQGVSYGVVWAWHRHPFEPIVSMNNAAKILFVIVTAIISFGSVLVVMAAVRVLGKEWSVTARVVEGHELVTSGPYRFVRHPIYTGMLGMLVATGLAVSHWLGLLIGLFLFVIGTAIRVRSEERLLHETFGARFEDYRQRVPAVVPFVL
ncbi:MAG TPA: isoprenylcysteine carboxylmethyltransferase family protein [Candidatus Angelobacter sp.]